MEAEAAVGNADAAADIRREISMLREKAESYTQQLKSKDEEIRLVKDSLRECNNNNNNNNNINNNESLRVCTVKLFVFHTLELLILKSLRKLFCS